MHVILLKVEHGEPAGALLEALRDAGVRATEMAAVEPAGGGGEAVAEASPLAVICEVAEGTDMTGIHAAIAQAVAVWPDTSVVACRRVEHGEPPADAHRLDTHALF